MPRARLWRESAGYVASGILAESMRAEDLVNEMEKRHKSAVDNIEMTHLCLDGCSKPRDENVTYFCRRTLDLLDDLKGRVSALLSRVDTGHDENKLPRRPFVGMTLYALLSHRFGEEVDAIRARLVEELRQEIKERVEHEAEQQQQQQETGTTETV